MVKIKPTRPSTPSYPNFKAGLTPGPPFTLSSFDLLGSQPNLTFKSQNLIKTKLGSFLTFLYLGTLFYTIFHYTSTHLNPPPTSHPPTPSILDTASKIGGLTPIITLIFTAIYYLYIENFKINELVNKGVLLAGKWGLDQT